jgi:phosphoribosylaminoimidazole carboxylase PurE protein
VNENPIVSVVMGSRSDLDTMTEATKVLSEFDVPYETRIVSAHRTPKQAHEFAAGARERGLRIIIAAAGKAAHLAGVLASLTTLPVIGVPMTTTDLGGLDSLLSTVQMPGGIPVATMAIGSSGARNAALLAVAVLGLGDEELASRLASYRQRMERKVVGADAEVRAGTG